MPVVIKEWQQNYQVSLSGILICTKLFFLDHRLVASLIVFAILLSTYQFMVQPNCNYVVKYFFIIGSLVSKHSTKKQGIVCAYCIIAFSIR